jgi:hypothetical protein
MLRRIRCMGTRSPAATGYPRHGFLFGQMSPHMLTKRPPLASRHGTISFDAECSDFQYFWHVERSAVAGRKRAAPILVVTMLMTAD